VDPIQALNLPESRWVDVDGPVHYRRWPGPLGEPAFVCVHGLGGSLLNWVPVAEGLAQRGPVVAMDLAGFGLTPPGDRGTGIGANWRLLHGFLEALDLPRVVLVGNSMGGMLSLIQAAHHPTSVERLVLVDAAFPRARALRAQPSPRIGALFALYANGRLGRWLVDTRVRRLGPERLVRETLRLISADSSTIDPAVISAMVEMAARRLDFDYATQAFLAAARSIFRSQIYPARYRALVRSVSAPALVMHGARDPLIPVGAAREATAEHPNWKLVEFDDVGHIPQLEAPERWLAAVEAWLDEPAGEAPSSAEAEGA
jgi:pimeloyl-ACP methyl ester carboxylesterase